ncbi:response regulator [Allopusillimonas ginsengisoli]|uniref:response regulator n=1 Tax=Allopusillimonas ginsengisoli TaxID=453575 RepID=UPI0014858C3C
MQITENNSDHPHNTGTDAKPVILFVEDEQDLREVVAEELADAGYDVVQACDGEDAMRLLATTVPNLILCDIIMPKMDGYEFLRKVRETRADLLDVPFVFLTAHDGSEKIVQGKHAGADDYLVKPIDFDLMLATVAARLRQMTLVRDKIVADIHSVGQNDVQAHDDIARKAFNRVAQTFNLVSSGIVLFDSMGGVRFANQAAKSLVAEGITPALDALAPVSSAHFTRAFSVLMQEAIQASQHGRDYTEVLSLAQPEGPRNLVVTICALETTAAQSPDEPAVAVFLSGGDHGQTAPLKSLQSMFDLTPTESRVAWAFAQGMRPEDIARSFGISTTTVAFHKRNIFQKTHTNRQADLIALLLTMPVSTPEA